MFALPDWLIKATGAAQFANNPANGFKPTAGDALQGIGHSLMEHYRANAAPQQPAAQPAAPIGHMPAPVPPAGMPPPGAGHMLPLPGGLSMSQISSMLGAGTPHPVQAPPIQAPHFDLNAISQYLK
jgi:hypothetical protein